MGIGAHDTQRILLATAAAALAACEVSPTQLVVVVDTDLATPGAMDGFRTRVSRAGREGGDVRRFTLLAESRADALPARLPATFGVSPRDGDARVTVDVVVEALRGDGVLFETRAVTGFVEHHKLRLDMFLASRCLVEHLDCDSDETCTIDGCVPPFIDPGALPEFDGLDAGGILDAGPDAATDAAPDGAADGGPVSPPDFAVLIAESDALFGNPGLLRAADDGLYVVAAIDGPTEVVDAGSFSPAGAGDRDTLLLRTDTSGALQASARLGAAGAYVTAYAAAVDDQDGLLVGGSYGGAPDLGGTVLPQASLPQGAAFVARFHTTDLSLDWDRTYPSSVAAAVRTVASDPAGGGVAIGGHFDEDIDLGGVVAVPRTAFLALLDPVAQDVSCRVIVEGVTSAVVSDVHFEPMGSVLVAGSLAGPADFGDGQIVDPGGVGRAGFVARYTTACALEGVVLASGIVDLVRAVPVAGGGAQMLGQVIGTLDIEDETFVGSRTLDMFGTSLDEQLSHVGTTLIGAAKGRDEPLDLAWRDGAPPLAGGWFRGDAVFGGQGVSAVFIDGFVTALGPSGFPAWVEHVTADGDEQVRSVAWHPTAPLAYALGLTDGSTEVGPALLEPRLALGLFLYGFAAPPDAE